MVFTVYVLYSEKNDKIYIGYTSNLLERFKSHNSLGKKGYTLRYRPWIIIYCEYFTERIVATKRETALKSAKGRCWIKEQINLNFKTKGFISA